MRRRFPGYGNPVVSWLNDVDASLFRRVVRSSHPLLDQSLPRISELADRSRLWFCILGVLALTGGERGRRTALRGALAIGATSAVVNGPLKVMAGRSRPRVGSDGIGLSLVPRPGSSSFPSGHSASAFAFATAVGVEMPALALPLLGLASSVAYSRVYTRVHYPGDVAAGVAIGIVIGFMSDRLVNLIAPDKEQLRVAQLPSGARLAVSRAVLVRSPHAGRENRLDEAKRHLQAIGVESFRELTINDLSGLDEEVRRSDEGLLVIAAGGDGTVGSVANRIVNTRAVLGILPLGTSNDFARSLNIPLDLKRAINLFANGTVSAVDAGRAELGGQRPRYFVHAATAGLNVNFAKLATSSSFRKRLGRLTYAVSGPLALRESRPFQCKVNYEGKTEELTLVQLSVMNSPVIGGAMDFHLRGSSLIDGKLDVLLVEDMPLGRVFLESLRSGIDLGRQPGGVRIIHVPELEVQTETPLGLAFDGEVEGALPASFAAAPRVLRVMRAARGDVRR